MSDGMGSVARTEARVMRESLAGAVEEWVAQFPGRVVPCRDGGVLGLVVRGP